MSQTLAPSPSTYLSTTSNPTPSNFVVGQPVNTPTMAPTVGSALSTGAWVGISFAILFVVVVTVSIIVYLTRGIKKVPPTPESAPLMNSSTNKKPTRNQMDSALGRGGASSSSRTEDTTWKDSDTSKAKPTVITSSV